VFGFDKLAARLSLRNEGPWMSHGTFGEVKLRHGDNTIEKIFARLTASESIAEASDKLMGMMSNSDVK